MISDNYVTGDNIYLRELQNFFFEVLGMMSVTHYGAVGDGRTDCYGPLQVAIDDAKRRSLSFIYVPMGRYIYTGELINMDGITFIGNPHAKIVNIRTCEEIPVEQFGWANGAYYSKTEADAKFVKIPGDTMTGSLAIGSTSTASGGLSFAQGLGCTASGGSSHAEGRDTVASGFGSHAEGHACIASGDVSHAENTHTVASGHRAHAEGWSTTASNGQSHSEGFLTVAQGRSQHAEGEGNIVDETTTENSDLRGTYIHIAGNGTIHNGEVQTRSNAYTLDWSGNGWFSGDVYVGSTSGTNKDEGSKRLATEEYVDNLIAQLADSNYFQESISPTVWSTTVLVNREYTATDSYGTWTIYADNSAGNDWSVVNAFDGVDSTMWKSDDVSQGSSVKIGMDFPILIKPTEFRIKPASATGTQNLWTASIQVKNTYDVWETLETFELPQYQNPSPILVRVETSEWCKGFRLVLTRPDGASHTAKALGEIALSKGFWKEMS